MREDFSLKNAYLVIYVSHSFLYANLAYEDSNAKKTLFLEDKSLLVRNFGELSSSETAEFWYSYFKNLEKKWKWLFLQKSQNSRSLFTVGFKKYESIGEGIVGCKVCILKKNTYYNSIFDSLRKFSVEIKIVTFDKDVESGLLGDFATVLEYDDILLLDLNSRFLKVSRVEKLDSKEKPNLSKLLIPQYNYSYAKKEWVNIPELLELLNGTKYKTFLSKYVPSNFMSNIWGNFLLNPVFKTNSDLLQDFIRAYITVQLLSLCSENPKVAKDFAVKPKKNLLWIVGDLVEIPKIRELVVAVIDGLQLKGSFDFVLDSSALLYTFGKSFTQGEKADEVVFKRADFLPFLTKVFAPDIDLKPESKKVVFQGGLFGTQTQSSEIFAMSSEITQIDVKDPSTMYLEGRFVRNAYIENFHKLFELRFLKDGISWNKVILDCRIKPVVYGPNVKANDIKFNMWLSGEPYS